MPQLSVLLPVYNAHRYLCAAVDSILAQTFTDFELLILDDGSTDDSFPILHDYARRDFRIRLLSQPNKGIIATLNELLALASAPFVARMDADDIALPHRFAAQIDYLNGHPECSIVGSQVLFIDDLGAPLAPKPDLRTTHAAIDHALLSGQWPIVHPSIMMRKSALDKIGPYRDFPTWEDHDLFIRLAEVGQVANLPEILLHYRLHLKSIVHQRPTQQSPVLAAIVSEARQRRGLPVLAPNQLPKFSAVSPLEHQRTWAWWALHAGNLRSARKHARSALKKAPFSLDSWRLLYCTLRGH